MIELCINKSKPFIYTSALPTFLVDDAIKRFDSDREIKRKNLWKNVNMFSKGLKKIGFDVKSLSHIIPIIIGKEKTTLEFGSYLFKNGIFAQPIRYPTVPYNEARIRVSITAMLTKNHITNSLNVFESAKRSFDYNDYRIRSKPPNIGEPAKKAIDIIVINATPTITNRLFIIKREIY